MSRFEIILVIILIIFMIGYLSFMSFLMYNIYVNGKRAGGNQDGEMVVDNAGMRYQTEFYNKSMQHAENILFGKAFDPQYGEAHYYGNKLMDVIGKLNDDAKKSIVIAMKYFSIEGTQARANEQTFRIMAVQEKVPVWFIILREATMKAVPEFFEQQNIHSNVIPISRVA